MLSQAPPVSLQFGRTRTHAGLMLGLGLLNLAVLISLGLQGADLASLCGLALLFGLVFCIAAVAWWQTPSGTLEWNGTAWHWSGWPQEEACRVQWPVALPGFSVLRLASGGGFVQCLLAGPAMQQDAGWTAFRRALVAHIEQGHGRGLGQQGF